MSTASLAIVVVAAGRGSRAGEGLPKQYRLLAGEPIITHALRALHLGAPQARILVTIHSDDRALYDAAVALLPLDARQALLAPVAGGATRQASVKAGLEALAGVAPEGWRRRGGLRVRRC